MTMPSPDTASTHTPWYVRGQKALLGVGGIAVAITSIWGVKTLFFPDDVADVAMISSVEVKARTPLSAFVPSGYGRIDFVQPGAKGDSGQLFALLAADSVDPETLDPDPDPDPSSHQPTPVPSRSMRVPEVETPSPSRSSSPPASPSDRSTPVEPPARLRAPVLTSISEDYETAVSEALASGQEPPHPDGPGSEVAPHELIPRVVPRMVTLLGASLTGSDGKLVSPDAAAALIAASLKEMSTVSDPGGVDPLGWTLIVNLRLTGLEGVPLLLTWSLDGVDATSNWGESSVAYEIMATTPDDTGIAEIWVPDLVGDGTTNVNVTLYYAESGLPATAGTPRQLPNE
jgi:hypothetical protein